MSVSEIAEGVANAFVNGNRKWARDELRAMPRGLGIGVALRVFESLWRDRDEYLQRSFMRTMTDDL